MWVRCCRNPLVWILLGAALLRIGAGVGLQEVLDRRPDQSFLIPGDAHGYWELGRKLADGEGYAIYDPPRRVMRMPGFPLVLAGAIRLADLLGLDTRVFLVARLLLAGVGTLACAMVYLLGKELLDRRTGLWAAGMAAVAPPLVGFSVVLLSETLFAACLTVSLWLMAKLLKTGFETREQALGFGLSLLVGVAVAAATYVRPGWLLVGPMFALFYVASVRPRQQTLIRSGVVLLGLAAALAPWVIRNHRVTGHWVVTTLWVGPSLYDGLNPGATGASDMSFFERDRLMERQGLTEYEMDRAYRRRARRFALRNPGRVLELAGVKLARFWKPWPNTEQFGSLWHRLAVALFFVPLVVLALRGWWVQRANVPAWVLTVGPILYFSVLHLVFVGSLRYRLPAEYPLCVLAAAGWQSWRPRRNRPKRA